MPAKLTTEEFVKRAIFINKNLYDYSLVNYIGAHSKIKIICKKHGIFLQKPNDHLKKQRCPKCFGTIKLTTKEFIEKAIKVHGNLFNYSKVIYKSNKTKVKIICKKHGMFKQIPLSHLKGFGCSKCSGLIKLTTKEFIEKAIKVHGDSYDYSLAKYANSHTKIKIICKKHGIFLKIPTSHYSGKQGCPRCSGLVRLTTKEFIEKAIKVHGDLFNYSLVNYINNIKKVEIICKKHGSFYQSPNSHLSGSGCDKCGGTFAYSTEEFIGIAAKAHGNLYDYSLVNYIDAHSKIKIICKKHGIFLQKPNDHLNCHGCPHCFHVISRSETRWLDGLNIPKEFRQFKIKINNKRFMVDGYSPELNTIYEFLGDYYHGNPNKFNPNDINKRTKKTFGELYNKTMNRINFLQSHGFNVVYIWENEFINKGY